jgi:hypothetical protein
MKYLLVPLLLIASLGIEPVVLAQTKIDLNLPARVIGIDPRGIFASLSRGTDHGFVKGRTVCVLLVSDKKKVCTVVYASTPSVSSIVLTPAFKNIDLTEMDIEPRFRWPEDLSKETFLSNDEKTSLIASFDQSLKDSQQRLGAEAANLQSKLQQSLTDDQPPKTPELIIQMKVKDKTEDESASKDSEPEVQTPAGIALGPTAIPQSSPIQSQSPSEAADLSKLGALPSDAPGPEKTVDPQKEIPKKKKKRKKSPPKPKPPGFDIQYGTLMSMGGSIIYTNTAFQKLFLNQTESNDIWREYNTVSKFHSGYALSLKAPIPWELSLSGGYREESFLEGIVVSDYSEAEPSQFSENKTSLETYGLWVDVFYDWSFWKYFSTGLGLGFDYLDSRLTFDSLGKDEIATGRMMLGRANARLSSLGLRIPWELRFRIWGISLMFQYINTIPLMGLGKSFDGQVGVPSDIAYDGDPVKELESSINFRSQGIASTLLIGIGVSTSVFN